MGTENKDEMQDKILDAALKRFTRHSAAKTTMNEIAQDLHCSKAALYYYFPDKKSLHQAVLERVADLYFEEMKQEAERDKPATRNIFAMVAIRQEFVLRFNKLELFRIAQYSSQTFYEGMMNAKKREIAIFESVIQKGIRNGEFAVDNPGEIAALLVQAMIGLRFTIPEANGNNYDMLEEKDVKSIIRQQVALAEIFVNGIMNRV
ncbi:TetR/AcrR family transcriptional regulator [Chitinophaga nivalis]|uniref:TetR/AcrR family transcriptional regulator n=1 Tax=Chitinophaga nivalis TaxID=2991709 RepID=A0ABT3IIJ6_9BACT|nr:TetR/AcrR family transcriptional regulator [Chitinophaga nivalis]MCW3466684.1 TetR/AcrR family transcriptional regulator [Chitinophaga nivalis]MCW3483625.1 TetR/AcrR family transcriptional regulator [Chitinophaga nivalis]